MADACGNSGDPGPGGAGDIELTLLMPCLDEAETLETCVRKAHEALNRLEITGEVLVADNGSTDGSPEIARRCGARVAVVGERGYGSALLGGIRAANGRFIIMADADDSYDWTHIDAFVERLRQGCELVMGCRLPAGGGTILPGAMPPLHRWVGNPVLSSIGRLFFRCAVTDFHCGMRGFAKEAVEKLDLRSVGMEFASEMVVKSTLAGLRVEEVPVTLSPDGRGRRPHLRTFRDGWRHLRFMLLYSPKWLFLYPGIAMMLLGSIGFGLLLPGPLRAGGVAFDLNTMLVSALFVLIGFQCISFWIVAYAFATVEGFLPESRFLTNMCRYIRLETGLACGAVTFLAGLVLLGSGVRFWGQHDFGPLPAATGLRIVISAVTLQSLGAGCVFLSFMLSIVGSRRR